MHGNLKPSKLNFRSLGAAALLLVGSAVGQARSVDQLTSTYSGHTSWDEASGTVRFVSSGNILFPTAGVRSFIWQIPPGVKQVQIAKDVAVNGAFHAHGGVTIDVVPWNACQPSSRPPGTQR
jgi:hypothetical protein